MPKYKQAVYRQQVDKETQTVLSPEKDVAVSPALGLQIPELLDTRSRGSLKNKAIALNSHYNWLLLTDEEGILCLVPRKKG